MLIQIAILLVIAFGVGGLFGACFDLTVWNYNEKQKLLRKQRSAFLSRRTNRA